MESLRLTPAEENYLKAVFKCQEAGETATTSRLAARLHTTPASVTDMVKKLSEKALLDYKPYKGVALTEPGQRAALKVIRKRRLWEVFLVEHLEFTWDAVHEIAEQLEHIESAELTQRLDRHLGYPRFDPHGDPIPDEAGNFLPRATRKLVSISVGQRVRVAAVALHTPEFLRYLDRLGLTIGTELTVDEHLDFDNSRLVTANDREILLNQRVAEQLLVLPTSPV